MPHAHDYLVAVIPAAHVPHYGFTEGAMVYVAPLDWFEAEEALYEDALEATLDAATEQGFGEWFSEVTDAVFETALSAPEAEAMLVALGLVYSKDLEAIARIVEGASDPEPGEPESSESESSESEPNESEAPEAHGAPAE